MTKPNPDAVRGTLPTVGANAILRVRVPAELLVALRGVAPVGGLSRFVREAVEREIARRLAL